MPEALRMTMGQIRSAFVNAEENAPGSSSDTSVTKGERAIALTW
jgi:hypothetical protein